MPVSATPPRRLVFEAAQARRLCELAGVPPDTDAETLGAALLEAIDEAMEERYDTRPDRAPAPTPAGHVAVPKARLEELEASVVENREAVLDAAAGKYSPENRDAWAAEYDRDPAAVLAHFEATALNPLWATPEQRAAAAAASAAGEEQAQEELYAAVFGAPSGDGSGGR